MIMPIVLICVVLSTSAALLLCKRRFTVGVLFRKTLPIFLRMVFVAVLTLWLEPGT
jgi:hypothetical protein